VREWATSGLPPPSPARGLPPAATLSRSAGEGLVRRGHRAGLKLNQPLTPTLSPQAGRGRSNGAVRIDLRRTGRHLSRVPFPGARGEGQDEGPLLAIRADV
jgi:hypothetical protein